MTERLFLYRPLYQALNQYQPSAPPRRWSLIHGPIWTQLCDNL